MPGKTVSVVTEGTEGILNAWTAQTKKDEVQRSGLRKASLDPQGIRFIVISNNMRPGSADCDFLVETNMRTDRTYQGS